MADKNIKKSIIPNENLPPIDRNLEGYSVRYRVVSEDKNRTSHWSPIILVQPEYNFVTGASSLHKANQDIVTVSWDPVSLNKVINSTTYFIRKSFDYDIWVRWDKGDNGDWIYDSRAQASSVSVLIPDTYYINGIDQLQSPNKLTVEIYLKGQPVTRDLTYLKMYTIGPTTI